MVCERHRVGSTYDGDCKKEKDCPFCFLDENIKTNFLKRKNNYAIH